MSYIGRRADSRVHQFRMRTPRAVLDRARGRRVVIAFPNTHSVEPHTVSAKVGDFVKFTLGTTDDGLARERRALAQMHIERFFAAIEAGPRNISFKHIVALSGEIYKLYMDMHSDDPGPPTAWVAFKALNRAAFEGRLQSAPPLSPGDPGSAEAAEALFGDDFTAGINALPRTTSTTALEERFGPLADWILTREGFDVDAPTRVQLLLQVAEASQDAGHHLKRNSRVDYSLYEREGRFPSIPASQSISVLELFDRWMKETRPAASTVSTWRGNVSQFSHFIGAKSFNASRITPIDVIEWKDDLVEKGLSAATINLGKIAAVKAIFNFAVANRLMATNPADDIRINDRRRAGTSRQTYTDEEVGQLLALARNEELPARRWLPLLAAGSGARIGELAQLWGKMIREQDGFMVMAVTPAEDGGSLKNAGSERIVPIHPKIMEEGFLAFVEAIGPGPLFYGKSSGREGSRHASKGTANYLASWIRSSGFIDPRKAPCHSMRHWFTSTATKIGLEDSVTAAIQGHAIRGESSRYRHFQVRTLAEAIARFPLPSPQ